MYSIIIPKFTLQGQHILRVLKIHDPTMKILNNIVFFIVVNYFRKKSSIEDVRLGSKYVTDLPNISYNLDLHNFYQI